jgi:putative SOS response-associated peptidase YedK
MCGRYALAFIQGFRTRFEVIDLQAKLEPRFNIAPSEEAPVIIHETVNKAVTMRWGLIPSWAKDMKIGNRLINARGETIDKRPAFRVALKKRRCLVPTTGFYEWKKQGDAKIPYYLHLKDDSIFAFAGLYEHWKAPDGKNVQSYTIVTTLPNVVAGEIHNRMPVILRREEEATWIAEGPLEDDALERILQPYPSQEMDSHRVSQDVNNPRNEGEDLIQPVRMAHGNL